MKLHLRTKVKYYRWLLILVAILSCIFYYATSEVDPLSKRIYLSLSIGLVAPVAGLFGLYFGELISHLFTKRGSDEDGNNL